ncbi:group II intron reverse transcriptase/maturase [compost metagenome]
MKRYGHLYEQSFSRAALWQGYVDARRSKAGRRACYQFERHLGAELEALHEELATGSYQPRPYFQFMVYEPKPRQIYAPAFRDCVVQHAIYNTVRPIFDRTFIDQSFACRPGLGTHRAADYAQRALQRAPAGSYTLQLDIRRFFYRIDRQILRRLIERKIKDARLVDVMMLFAQHDEPVGIPIGNLLSQLYALIYLNPVDHYVTRQLKPPAGYCRYVDDFILFGLTREQALEYRQRIVAFLGRELHLELSRSTIAPTRRGVNFVGYRTWAGARFIRKHSLYKARRAIRTGNLPAVVSHLGHARRTHSLRHLINLIREQNHALYRALPETHHPRDHARAQRPGGRHRAVHD